MIKLDFALNPYISPGSDPDWLLIVMEYSAFKGFTTFIIDDVDFSNSIPILWLAWHFRRTYRWIKLGTLPYAFYNDEQAYGFKFTKSGEQIEIIGPWYGSDEKTISKGCSDRALVPANDFKIATRSYYRRAYKACINLCPPMKTSPKMQAWLYQDFLVKK
jgi:hypothetical protein